VADTSFPAGDSPSPASGRRALGWFVLILVVLHLPILLGRVVFTRDIAHWIFPALTFVRQSLLAGELPLWNPYQGLGFPVLGDPLYGVFYPPSWLLLLLPASWVANGITTLHFLHMVWGGLGVFVLARRLRATALAAAMGALAWSLSGYMTAQWSTGLLLHAGAFIPWVAVGHLALLDSLRAGGGRWMTGLVKAALPTGLALLLGEAFLAVMGIGLAAGVLAVVQISERRREPKLPGSPRWLALHVLAVALAIGMGAVVLVPARAGMAGSPRAHPLSRDDAEVSSLHPLRMLELVAPGCMGDPYGDYPARAVVGEPRLDGLPLSYSVYLGASVLALALIAMRRRALELGLAGLTGFALLVAFGKHLPVHALIRRLVPPLAYMRFPEKYLTLVVVGVAVLAALGAARVLSGERQPWRRTLALLLTLVAAGIAAPFIFPYPWSGFMALGLRHGAIAVLAVLGVQVLAARASRLAPALLVAVVTLDLAVSTWNLQGFVPRAIATATPPAASLIRQDRAGRLEPARIYRSPAVDRVMNQRAAVGNAADGELRLLATLIPSTVNVWGIASLPGYDAAIPANLDRLWNAGWSQRASHLPTLRLLGADYAVLPAPEAGHENAQSPGLEPMADLAPGARLYRVTGSLPPVFLVGRGEVLADEETLPRLFEPEVVAGEVALLAPGTKTLAGPPGRAGSCTLTSYSPRHLSAHCQAEREALAVFVEQLAPGWQATVDGHPAPIERANLVMRALRLSPGTHEIAFDYQAPGLGPGLAASLLSLAGLLGLVVVRWRRRK
jgi:hypothetical protein